MYKTCDVSESSQCSFAHLCHCHGCVLKVMIFNEFGAVFMLHIVFIVIQILTCVLRQTQNWKMFNHLIKADSFLRFSKHSSASSPRLFLSALSAFH